MDIRIPKIKEALTSLVDSLPVWNNISGPTKDSSPKLRIYANSYTAPQKSVHYKTARCQISSTLHERQSESDCRTPSRKSLKLHYPSFTSEQILDGQIADTTSPCPKHLMSFGFTEKNAFWLEAYFRREDPKNLSKSPLETCAPNLNDAHNCFARWCESNLAAKIEVHFGKRNRVEHQNLSTPHAFLSKSS